MNECLISMKLTNEFGKLWVKEEDIVANISKEIDRLSRNSGKDWSFLILEKDEDNFIQCACFDKKYGYTFILEKKETGRKYNCLSSKLSVERFFKKWLKSEEYKVIKYWQDGDFEEIDLNY